VAKESSAKSKSLDWTEAEDKLNQSEGEELDIAAFLNHGMDSKNSSFPFFQNLKKFLR
jgi:hypothetical protein